MVGHSSLRIIVSTDLGRAVTGADHGLALGRDTVEILLVFKVIESGTEFLEGPVLVFELRAFLLTLHDETRRNVGETHRRVGCVHALSSRTGRAEKVKSDVVPTEINIKFSRFRKDCDRSRRGLYPALGFGLGHPLDTVHARFVFHHAVNAVVSAELKYNLLVSAAGSRGLVGNL